jgi:predicted pyridoxine 5'-phosphate oxidase superfamily flavin-nucleotide-binding protein
MAMLDAVCREVLEATEFVAIVTSGPDGPHVVATWGDYVRQLGIEDDRLLIPAGSYQHTEENLGRDPRIQLLVGSRRAEGTQGPGQGCLLEGTGTIVTSGEEADRVKAKFPWARGALVVRVEKVSALL